MRSARRRGRLGRLELGIATCQRDESAYSVAIPRGTLAATRQACMAEISVVWEAGTYMS